MNILEQQQTESEQRLKQARLLHQRQQEQQAEIEKQLETLKYKNAQHRVDVDRSNDILSTGQRRLLQARAKVDRGGSDLQNYDRKLKRAVDIRHDLAMYGRNQDQRLSSISSMVKALQRVSQGAENDFKYSEGELEKVKQRELEMRTGLRNEGLQQSRRAEDIANVRDASIEEERRLTLAIQQENALEAQVNSLYAEKENAEGRQQNAMRELSEKLGMADKNIIELEERKKQSRVDLRASSHRLTDDWDATIILQKAEGHKTSLLPSETSEPPVLETDAIRSTLVQEQKAVVDEVSVKQEMEKSISTLRDELSRLRECNSSSEKEQTNESNSLKDAIETEENRALSNEKLSERLDTLNGDSEQMSNLLSKAKTGHHTRLSSLAQHISTRKKENETKLDCSSAASEMHRELRSSMSQMEKMVQENKESNQLVMVDLEKELHGERQICIELQAKCTSSHNVRDEPGVGSEILEKHQKVLTIIGQAYKSTYDEIFLASLTTLKCSYIRVP